MPSEHEIPPILIIDGHSIIHAWHDLHLLHTRRPESARDHLLALLTEFHDMSPYHIVAVFDGAGREVSTGKTPGEVQVFYSKTGMTADDVIEQLVRKYAGKYRILVATRDRLEAEAVMAEGAHVISPKGLEEMMETHSTRFRRETRQYFAGES